MQTPDDYGFYGSDQILVGYYPSWDSGVAYQAVFGADADPEEIMDLILSSVGSIKSGLSAILTWASLIRSE